MADPVVHSMHHRCHSCGRISADARKSPVSPFEWCHVERCIDSRPRSWLIDVGKDAQGLRVIVDLHGGEEQNEMAQAEYTEIKDKVMFEVRKRTLKPMKKSDQMTA
jgi:hypothetical protein